MITKKMIFQGGTISIISIIFWFVWTGIVVLEYEKLPDDYHVYIEHEGEDQIEEELFEGLSEPFRLQEALIQEVIGIDGDVLTIKSNVIGFRAENKEQIFDSERIYKVNRHTLTHVDSGKLFGFLPEVKRQNYESFHPLIFQDASLNFERIDNRKNFECFVFSAETKEDDYSFAYSQYAPFKVLGDTSSEIWIEPKTGNMIRFEQSWEVYYFENDQKRVVEKGWKKTTPFTETILNENTLIELENMFYFKYLIPAILTILIFSSGALIIFWNNYQTAKRNAEGKEKIAIVGELSSRFAHDVRNPLSNINMAAELIRKKRAGELSLSEKENLDTIQKNLDRINHQVENVLDFIRTPTLEKKVVNLTSCLKESIFSLNVPKNIKIGLPKSGHSIYADPYHIQIVFKNLILNSIQAIGEKEGIIEIKYESNAIHDIIKIIDSGPGIEKMDLLEIFEPLSTTKQEGTGLGLVSCKNIIEKHGGKITAKNNPTEFTIELPKK